MNRAVVTGLGFITSIGNSRAEVLESLRTQRSGIEIHPEFNRPEIPVKLAGTIKGFEFPTENFESWKFPPGLSIPRQHRMECAAGATPNARRTGSWSTNSRRPEC
jgi:3-oxoacyl-(acyl-carrier-protein) synthase